MFMDLYANNEMTKPSCLMNPVFCCADVLHLFFILKYFFSFIIFFVQRERERERERMSFFFFENHSMLLIAACFITETCPCKMQRFVSAVKKK